jgi:hypothetical protein
MKWLTFILFAFVGAGAAATPGRSNDGTPFPEAVKDRMVKIDLPGIGDKLGCLPPEMGRVFDSSKSVLVLKKHIGDPVPEKWFALGFRNADVASFDLTDGRVTRIVLRKSKPSIDFANAIARQVAKLDGAKLVAHQTISAKNPAGASPILVNIDIDPTAAAFEVDAVVWYLLHHDVPAPIASAMRQKLPVKGMTLNQALCAFGTPEAKQDGQEGELRCTWHERVPIEQQPTVSYGDSRELYMHLVAASLAGEKNVPKRISRTIGMTFVGETAIDVSDVHYK